MSGMIELSVKKYLNLSGTKELLHSLKERRRELIIRQNNHLTHRINLNDNKQIK